MTPFDLTPYFPLNADPVKVVHSIHRAAKVLGYKCSDKFGLMFDGEEIMRLDNDEHCGDRVIFWGDPQKLHHLADIAGCGQEWRKNQQSS